MKNSLTETHEHLNTTWVSSWAIIVVLDCRPLDEDLGSRYYKRMIAMIMTIMMRRMGLMMTDSQRRDKSRLTEDLVSSRPSRVDDDEDDDDAENPPPPGCAPHRPLPD